MNTKTWNTGTYVFFLFVFTFGVKSLDIRWVWTSTTDPSSFPDAPFVGISRSGDDGTGERVYMARVSYMNNVIPAVALLSTKEAHFNLGGSQLTALDYEVLVGTDIAWYPVFSPNSSQIPVSAIEVGYLSDGTILHACRANKSQGELMPGLIDPNTMQCNFSTVDNYPSYEVLISSPFTQQQPNETISKQQEAEFRWEGTASGVSPCTDRNVLGGVFSINTGTFTANSVFSRIHHGSNLVPTFIYSYGSFYNTDYAFEGKSYRTFGGEVICGTGVAWQIVSTIRNNVNLPSTALPVGYMANGTLIYACRTITETGSKPNHASYVSGMFLPSSGKCQVLVISSYSGTPPIPNYYVEDMEQFEVLIRP